MTPYALLLQACGLSQAEAARFHGARRPGGRPIGINSLKDWSSGRAFDGAPPGPMAELRALYAAITRSADHALAVIAASPAGAIELGYPADDHEAQALGLPCVGAWWAMARMVVAGCDRPVRLVPRGCTLETAAAADAHEL